jgi:hypothetical protein
MTIAPASCEACGTPFHKKRVAQTTCSKSCKQVLWRQKCNAKNLGASGTSNASEQPPSPAERGEFTHIWGPNKLSGIELRMLRLEPTGLRMKPRGDVVLEGRTMSDIPSSQTHSSVRVEIAAQWYRQQRADCPRPIVGHLIRTFGLNGPREAIEALKIATIGGDHADA